MNLQMTGGRVSYKLLSYHLTGHIIWMSRSISKIRVPYSGPGLDFITYAGPGPADAHVFEQAFRNYKLVCSLSTFPYTFSSEDLPQDIIDKIKMYRVKAFALHSVNTMSEWAMEKNGVSSDPLLNQFISSNRIAEIYHSAGIVDSVESGIKLINFKQEEKKQLLESVLYAQLEAEIAIETATTVNRVVEIYRNFLDSIGAIRMSERTILSYM